MNALRTTAAIFAVAMSFVLVGCGDEDGTDTQTQDQTSATTFSANVSGTSASESARHAPARQATPRQSETSVSLDP